MSEKCNKYESLFIFGSEEDFNLHLAECECCRSEHEKMQKISGLVKEVKPFYNKKSLHNRIIIKAAACFMIMMCSFWAYNTYNTQMIAELNYESEILIKNGRSMITDAGLPTDDYGLIITE